MDLKEKEIPIELQDFFSMIYTKNDLVLFYKEIDQVIADLFKSTEGIKKVLDDQMGHEKSEKIMAFLRASGIDVTNQVKIQEQLQIIKELGNLLPVVSLTLAFEPSAKSTKNISLWFNRNLEQKVLLEISLERGIIGGAHISLDGLYHDGTLKTGINHLLDTKKYI
ncbi:MAG: F0F1 ATP synthase subunit delta [Candidatus Levyibacteriota bacterium]